MLRALSSDSRARFLAAVAWWLPVLTAAGCGQTYDVWVTPGATLSVTTVEGRSTREVGRGRARVRIARADALHHLRIEAPGRSTIVVDSAIGREGRRLALGSQINAFCLGRHCTEVSALHPIEWLASEGRPFEIPAQGEGIIVSASASNAEVVVNRWGPDRQLLGSARHTLPVSRAHGDRSAPLVIPSVAGVRHSVGISAEGRETVGADNITVHPGEYTLIHAFLAMARPHRPSGLD